MIWIYSQTNSEIKKQTTDKHIKLRQKTAAQRKIYFKVSSRQSNAQIKNNNLQRSCVKKIFKFLSLRLINCSTPGSSTNESTVNRLGSQALKCEISELVEIPFTPRGIFMMVPGGS